MVTRILAIVPYPGMKELIERIAAERSDIELTVIVKNLDDAASIIHTIDLQEYDVILSRGGTANVLEKISTIPVVDIPLSGCDILSAIRSASMLSDHYAIVGFQSITRSAQLVLDIVREHADIFTIKSTNDAVALIKSLKKQNYNLVVGDVITLSCAQKAQMNGVLFVSGEESINAALNQAVNLCKAFHQRAENNELLHSMIAVSETCFALFDEKNQLLYTAGDGARPAGFPHFLEKYVPSVVHGKEISLLLNDENCNYPVKGKRILYRSSWCALFFIQPAIPVSPDDSLWITTNIPAESSVSSFGFQSSQNPAMKAVIDQLSLLPRNKQPVWIFGETGAGKDYSVQTIHMQSDSKRSTLTTLDARFATPKRWAALLDSINSPLCYAGIGIYFKNVESMDHATKVRLMEYIHHTQLHRRNQLYFTWELPFQGTLPMDDPLYKFVLNELGGCSVSIPPLRSRTEDILALAALFIHAVNFQYGKQVIGPSNEALQCLQAATWPHNLSDLKRLITEAVLMTDTPYINEKTVSHLLSSAYQTPQQNTAGTFFLNGTLYEITQRVIRSVLAEEKNNQRRTAQRLGISRGTLWKRLKEIEEKEST